MRRAKIFLAIIAYVTLAKRFLSKPLLHFLRRIKRKYRLIISLFSSNSSKFFIQFTHTTHSLFSSLNLGLQEGFLVRFLRI